MAKPKYKQLKGQTRTPEEHRKILQQIDDLQRENSRKGVSKSKSRIAGNSGLSSTAYKKSRKPKDKKPRIYDIGRYARE